MQSMIRCDETSLSSQNRASIFWVITLDYISISFIFIIELVCNRELS